MQRVGPYTLRVAPWPSQTFLSGKGPRYALRIPASGGQRSVAEVSCARRPFVVYRFPGHVVVRCQSKPFGDILIDTASGAEHLLWSASGPGYKDFAYEKLAWSGQDLLWVAWRTALSPTAMSSGLYDMATGLTSPLPAPFRDLDWFEDAAHGVLYALSGSAGHLQLWSMQDGRPVLRDPGPLPQAQLVGLGPDGAEWFEARTEAGSVLEERAPDKPLRRWRLRGFVLYAGAGWAITGRPSGVGPQTVFFALQGRSVTLRVPQGQHIVISSRATDAVLLP